MKVIKALRRLFNPFGKENKEGIDVTYEGAIPINKSFIKLGNRVSFGGNVLLNANAPIEIGDDTMIAYNTIITTSSHDYLEHPMWVKRVDSPIKIGKHVWIGVNSIILPGVIIEDYAVVAAGCIVVDNVPEGAIVAGNPARIINYRNISRIKNQQNRESEYPGKQAIGGFRQNYCKNKI